MLKIVTQTIFLSYYFYQLLILFLDATDRAPVRAVVVAHTATAADEAEVVGVAVVVRPGRPIVAVEASIAGIAAAVDAAAGSREEHLGIFINRNIIFYI